MISSSSSSCASSSAAPRRPRPPIPAFLRDLKDLTDSYDNPWPNQIFSDNFNNGQYPDNRRWKVTAGNWRIVTQPSPGLLTRVDTQQQGQYGNNGQNVL